MVDFLLPCLITGEYHPVILRFPQSIHWWPVTVKTSAELSHPWIIRWLDALVGGGSWLNKLESTWINIHMMVSTDSKPYKTSLIGDVPMSVLNSQPVPNASFIIHLTARKGPKRSAIVCRIPRPIRRLCKGPANQPVVLSWVVLSRRSWFWLQKQETSNRRSLETIMKTMRKIYCIRLYIMVYYT